MSRELRVPVLALSQLSRNTGDNGEPSLVDLRESGSIEQDADVVIFLYREVNKDDNKPVQNVVNCTIKKNRNGVLSSFQLAFDWGKSAFHNISKDEEE